MKYEINLHEILAEMHFHRGHHKVKERKERERETTCILITVVSCKVFRSLRIQTLLVVHIPFKVFEFLYLCKFIYSFCMRRMRIFCLLEIVVHILCARHKIDFIMEIIRLVCKYGGRDPFN